MMPRVLTSMLLAVIVSSPAAAQDQPDAEHNQSIGGGAQWALPHTLRGEPPGVQVSWRRWFSPRFGVGTDFRWWVRNTTSDSAFPEQQGPPGVTIPAMQIHEDREVSSYGLGVGLLARHSIGRVSFIGGAGPGFFLDRTTHDTELNGTRNAGSSSYTSVGAQFLGEIEVQATSRLSFFGGLRIEWRNLASSESSSGFPTVGIRLAF